MRAEELQEVINRLEGLQGRLGTVVHSTAVISAAYAFMDVVEKGDKAIGHTLVELRRTLEEACSAGRKGGR